MNDCKDPTCVYSLKTKKCVKPNPYVQYLPQCKKQNIPLAKCKENYKLNIDEIKKKACNYYKDNLQAKIDYNASCPKNRRPDYNDNCPANYPVLKKNKYDVKCCYKEAKPKKVNSIKERKMKSTPLNEFKMPNSDEYLNKKTNKYFKLLKKYQDKIKPKKIKM